MTSHPRSGLRQCLTALLLGLFVLAATLPARPARGDEAEPPWQWLRALAGSWEGELYYLDYQSGQRFGIPMRVDARLTPDGRTLIREITYTDPGRVVYATTLTTIDAAASQISEAFFREGEAQLLQYQIDADAAPDPGARTVVYQQEGEDGGRPALIRHRLSITGDRITAVKAVKFEGDDTDWIERNGSDLHRITD